MDQMVGGDVGTYRDATVVQADDVDVLSYEAVEPGVHQLAIGTYEHTLNVRGTQAQLQALAIEILVAASKIEGGPGEANTS